MDTSPTSPLVSAAEPDGRHLILVGLPGAGKSAVGALLAKALGRPFLDFDVEIARRAGMSVASIFRKHGESHFREMERALTDELRRRSAMVLAPGGGWIMHPDNVALVRPPARLAYLEVTPATAVRRMGAGVAKRPLLRHGDPVGELVRILEVRRDAYTGADLTVRVEGLAPQQVAARVLALLSRPDRTSASAPGTPG